MKMSELVKRIYSTCDAAGVSPYEVEILISDEDEHLHDIEVDFAPESFDGFETVFPAAITLKQKEE